MKKSIGLIAAIFTIIAGGIAIYEFSYTTSKPSPSPPPPPVEVSILEKLKGNYSLESWTNVNRNMDLGIKVVKGNLKVNSIGMFDWDVELSQISTPQPKKVGIKSRGKLLTNSMQILGQPGKKYNGTYGIKNAPFWGNVRASEELAIKGWTYQKPERWTDGKKEDPFFISYNKLTNGKEIVNMKNSWGIFTWVK